MKRLLSIVFATSMVFPLCAQQEVAPENAAAAEAAEDEFALPDEEPATTRFASWPIFFAVGELPETPDIAGVRLTIPFSTRQENVTGFDIGLWGRAQYFEGFMLNILRNDVKDQLSGFQAGLYNTAAQADMIGLEVGLWNEAGALRGVQAGAVNIVGQMQGVQIGIINRAENLYGFQIGIVNIIRDAEMPFCPVLNIGF